MRNIIFVLTAILIGASASAATKSKSAKSPKKKLTQEAVFSGANVNGKYQIAGGAVSAVENEKTLNDIIGGRKDFKDRLKQDLASAQSKSKSNAKSVAE